MGITDLMKDLLMKKKYRGGKGRKKMQKFHSGLLITRIGNIFAHNKGDQKTILHSQF